MDKQRDPRLIIIRRLWDKHPISQYHAARILGVTQACISQYLTGKIKLNTDMIINFANLLDVKPSEIDSNLDF